MLLAFQVADVFVSNSELLFIIEKPKEFTSILFHGFLKFLAGLISCVYVHVHVMTRILVVF